MSDDARLLADVLTEMRALRGELAAVRAALGAGGPAVAAATGIDILAAKTAELRTAAGDLDLTLSGDGFIGEYGAARLLRRAPLTLRNWRYGERPLPFRKSGGRIEYALSDLAGFLCRAGDLVD